MRLFAVWVQAGLKTLIRTPRSAFFTLVFPMILLLLIDSTNSGSVTAAGGKVDFAQYFTPSLAIFGLSFACYTSLVFSIPRAREQGILKRVRGTPLEPSIYLSALIAVALLAGLASVTLMVIVGVAAFGVHLYLHLLPAAIVTLVLGGLCLAALGIAVSSFVVRADTAPVVANLTLLPLTFISGVFSPLHGAPGLGDHARPLLPAQPPGRRVLRDVQPAHHRQRLRTGVTWRCWRSGRWWARGLPCAASAGTRSRPAHAAGSESQTSAPPPARLRAPASPPCAAAIAATIASPSPVPSPERPGSPWLKRSNARPSSSSEKPSP